METLFNVSALFYKLPVECFNLSIKKQVECFDHFYAKLVEFFKLFFMQD